MHLCVELTAASKTLESKEVGVNFSLELSLQTQFAKIKKLPSKINVKNIKIQVYKGFGSVLCCDSYKYRSS